MFFTTIGGIVAVLSLALGVIGMGAGFLVAQSDNYVELARRYFGSKTTGDVIDQGLTLFVFGIALGILVEISRSVRPPSR